MVYPERPVRANRFSTLGNHAGWSSFRDPPPVPKACSRFLVHPDPRGRISGYAVNIGEQEERERGKDRGGSQQFFGADRVADFIRSPVNPRPLGFGGLHHDFIGQPLPHSARGSLEKFQKKKKKSIRFKRR